MGEYVFYLRTEEGHIQRLSNIIATPRDYLIGDYRYKETLINFPETTVFWASELRSTVGIAPLISDLPGKYP
ncbi:MAG: hypothetical protein H0U72_01845 [Nitrosospira sp.]|nr:hypothetical protein [Nitrosospira sp.]